MSTYTLASILFILIFAVPCSSIPNPGLLFQIPTPYQLPCPEPSLPQQIPSIILTTLQLTDISLRQLTYSWRYEQDKFIILLENTLIAFDWKYGKDQGLGTFVEQFSDLVIDCSFGVDHKGRFSVDIQGAKITNQDKRHAIKINLGGQVKETVVVEVTNLILNHAKAAFRSSIKSAISSIVLSFTKPLRQDIKLYCSSSTPSRCLYLNTSLLSSPIWSQQTQLLQLDGSPYIDSSSSPLSPSSAMFKINSKDIYIQVHQELITRALQLYNDIENIRDEIVSTDISGVCDIDSQTLGVVFPGMKALGQVRPVLFQVQVQNIVAEMDEPPLLSFEVSGSLKIQTKTQNPQPTPYLNKASATSKIKLSIQTSKNRLSTRLSNLQVTHLDFDPKDIAAGLVNPPELTKHLDTLMQWAVGGVNGSLNEKVIELDFMGIGVEIQVGVVKGVAVGVGVGFGKVGGDKQDVEVVDF